MTDEQWKLLLRVIDGEEVNPAPAGFIIDSPWLPNWFGIPMLNYFSSDDLWFTANLKVVEEFPEILFLPGFWSEFGMCTEPSAFGARCTFPANEFPHAHRVIHSEKAIEDLSVPNPETDGLLPFMLNRLRLTQPKIETAGHKIRFAVARGPLNISSYLMGSTEFLTAMMLQPDMAGKLVRKVTEFLKSWLMLQIRTFPTIDGILLLDDIIGFIGKKEFLRFGLPYFKQLFDFDVSVKFLHNDAPCEASAPFLPEMGVNLFNMGFEISLSGLKKLTQNKVTLFGNIPPRDVLANGSPEEIKNSVNRLILSLEDKTRIIYSCGGGMPPGVSSENIKAFSHAVHQWG